MILGKQLLSIKMLMRRGWLDTEMRVQINTTKVDQYAHEIADGAKFPPPVVFIDEEEVYRVGDGFHRILARKQNRESQVQIDLQRGNFLAACLHNMKANAEQKGLPFSTGDLKRCLLTLLKTEESAAWSQEQLRAAVGCSAAYVSLVVKEFKRDGGTRPASIPDRNGRNLRAYHTTGHHGDPAERRAKALELYQEGKSKIEIGQELDISRLTVARYIEDAMAEDGLVTCPHCHGTGMVKGTPKNGERRKPDDRACRRVREKAS